MLSWDEIQAALLNWTDDDLEGLIGWAKHELNQRRHARDPIPDVEAHLADAGVPDFDAPKDS